MSQSKDPKEFQLFKDVIECYEKYWLLGDEVAPVELWQPFTTELAKKCDDLAKQGHNVAIGFAVYKSVMRDFARTLIPSVKFVHVDVAVDTLCERGVVRTRTVMALSGMTMQDVWNYDVPTFIEARKKFGDVYSDENYKQFTKDGMLKGFEGFYPGEKNIATVDNEAANTEGIEQLKKIVGITNKDPIDLKAIEQVQFARMANNNYIQEMKV